MDNIFKNPLSKLFLSVPLLYALEVVITCPCAVTLSCHQTEFFTSILVAFAIATVILTYNFQG